MLESVQPENPQLRMHCMKMELTSIFQASRSICKGDNTQNNHCQSSETCHALSEGWRRTGSSSAVWKRSINHKLLLSIDLSNTGNGIVVRDARDVATSDTR